MIFWLIFLCKSNDFRIDPREKDSEVFCLAYYKNYYFGYQRARMKINNGNVMTLGNIIDGVFTQGIYAKMIPYYPENENAMYFDFYISNNGTSAKRIDFEHHFWNRMSENYNNQVEFYGNLQGVVHYIKGTNTGVLTVVRGEEGMNPDTFYVGQGDSFGLNTTVPYQIDPHQAHYQIGYLNRMLDIDSTIHFRTKFTTIPPKNPPIIVFTNELNDRFDPNDEVYVAGRAEGVFVGQQVEVFCKFEDGNPVQLGSFVVTEESNSTEFNYTFYLPNAVKKYEAGFWTTGTNSMLADVYRVYFPATARPYVTVLTEINPVYYVGSAVMFDFTIWDDRSAALVFKFDNEPESVSDMFTCNNKEKNSSKTFNLPSNIQDGIHNISIRAKDDYGVYSNETIYQIEVMNRQKAYFAYKKSPSKGSYNYHHNISLTFKIAGGVVDDYLSLYHRRSITAEPILVENFTYNGTQIEYTYTFPVQPINKDDIWEYFFIKDQNGVTTDYLSYNYYCRRNTQCFFTVTNYDTYYPWNTAVNLSAVCYDFDPGTEVTIYYWFDNKEYAAPIPKQTMDQYYSIEPFTFEINLPNASKRTEYRIYCKPAGSSSSSSYSSVTITTNNPPQLFNIYNIEELYLKGVAMNVIVEFIDYTKAALNYKFDNGRTGELSGWITSNNKIVNGSKSINLPDMGLKSGNHTVLFWVRDEFNGYSAENINVSFAIADYSIMEFNVDYRNQKNLNFKDYLKDVYYYVLDRDNKDIVTVSYLFDDDENFTTLYQYTSSASYHSFYRNLYPPKVNGQHTVISKACDNRNVCSQNYSFTFTITQSPTLTVSSAPSNGVVGDNMTFKGTIYDFNEGEEVQIHLVIGSQQIDDSLLPTVNLTSTYTVNYNFQVVCPDILGNQQYRIWATSASHSCSEKTGTININRRPQFYDLKPLDPQYSQGEVIFLELTVTDNEKVAVYWQYDGNGPSGNFPTVTCNGQNQTVSYQIPTAEKIFTLGLHTLTIWLKDNRDVTQTVIVHEFDYVSLRAPEIEVSRILTRDIYYFHEKAQFNISVRDRNFGDNIRIFAKIDENDPLNIANISSINQWQNFIYTYEYPKENTTHNIIFYAMDDDSTSGERKFTIKVVQTPVLIVLSELDAMYEPGTKVNISFFVGDFEIGNSINISYRNNNDALVFPQISPIINDDYKSDIMTFELTLPTYSRRNSIYIYSKNSNGISGQRVILYTTTNLPPKIVSMEQIKDEYSSNEYINLDMTIFDDTQVMIYYKFDRREWSNIKEWIPIRNTNLVVHRQIQIPRDYFKGGQHTLYFYIVDEYNIKTDEIVCTFDYIDKHAPEMDVFLVGKKNVFGFYETIKFNISVFDKDADDFVRVLMKTNDSEFKEIRDNINATTNTSFIHEIESPKVDGKYVLIFQTRDSTDSSSQDKTIEITIKQQPRILIEDQIAASYSGGEDALISGYVVDFDINKNVQVFYTINQGSRVYATSLLQMKENYYTDMFNFTIPIPNKVGVYSVVIYAEDDNSKRSESVRYVTTVNVPPRIENIEDLKPIYYSNGYIEFNATVFDDSKSKIVYKFDQGKEVEIDEYIDISGKTMPIRKQIKIPDNMNVGQHSITFFLRDIYKVESNSITKNFEFAEGHVPILNVKITNQKQFYKFHEEITFNGSIQDFDDNDHSYVYYELDNNGENIPVADFPSTGEIHNFTYSLKTPTTNGDHVIIFKARDESGAEAGEQKFIFKVQRTPQVIFTSKFDSQYLPNSTIFFSGYLVDFDPDSSVQLYYRINSGIVYYATLPLKTFENYTSEYFEFNATLPTSVGRQYLYVWADNGAGIVTRTETISLITNKPPNIVEWKKIKDSYSISEFIEFEGFVGDDSSCWLYYYFDNGKHKKLNEKLTIKDDAFPLLKQIPIEDVDIGHHNITVYFKDEYGSNSNEITYEFDFKDKHAPEIVLNALPKRGDYKFYESITFSGSVRDLDEGDTVMVGFKIGSSQLKIIYDSESDGKWHDFSYSMRVPQGDADYVIRVVAVDQTGAKSEELNLKFRVSQKPVVNILSKFEKSYSPGENVSVSCNLLDFNSNSTVFLYYSLDGDGKNFVSEVTMFENMTSPVIDFDVELPNKMQDHYLIMWVENELSHVICPYNENYIIVSIKPTMNVTNEISTKIYKHQFIEVDVEVYDDTDVYVYYAFDDMPEKRISNKIQSFYEIESRILQIEVLENSLTVGSHVLHIFCRDEFGKKSDVIDYNVEYFDNRNPPTLKVDYKLKSYTYGFFENIDVKFNVTDTNPNDEITLYMRFNFDKYLEVHKFTSTGEPYVFPYTIQNPLQDGFHTVSLVAINQDNISSKVVLFEFEVRRYPGVELTKNLKVNYKTDEAITVSGYAVDYDPYTYLDVYYKLDNNEKIRTDRLIVQSNFKTEEFSITLDPPSDVNIHTVTVWLEKLDGKQVFSITGNFIVNSKPEISMITPLNDIYYNNDHISLDFNATDNTVAKICYNFDGNSQKCLVNEGIFYKKQKSYHFQIKTDNSYLNPGPHVFNLYAIDEFGEKSNVFTHEFNFEISDAPDLLIDSIYRSDVYNFYENITVKGRARDRNTGDKIKIFYRFNFTEYVEIAEVVGDGEWQEFSGSIRVPQNNASYFITIHAQDNNGARSVETRHDFKVQFKPCIKLLNSIQNSYMPGDNVTIQGFAGDFEEGKVLKLYYQLKEKDSIRKVETVTEQLIGEYSVLSNMTTGLFSFNIDIPETVTPQSFKIWAKYEDKVVASLDKGYSVINIRPRMKILNKVKQDYYNRGFIDLDVSIWDNTRVQLWYCIDGGREINLTEMIESNGVEQEVSVQIELPPHYYEFGPHRLFIFVRDEHGAESADKIYDFVLIDKNAPDMEILSVTKKEQYEYYDVMVLEGRVRDLDVGDRIFVNLQINKGGYTEIFSTIATGEWQNFSYTFNVPKNDGLHIVTFQAQDVWQAASRQQRYNVKVRRTRGISMRTTFPRYYEIHEHVHVGGYVVGYGAERKIRVGYRYAHQTMNTRFYIDITTIHNSISDVEFVKNLPLPTKKVDDLIIEVVDENETVLDSFNQTIVVNQKPNFAVINELSSKFAGDAFIGLDINLTDDTKAYMIYKIDDGDEMNLTELIRLNGLHKMIRNHVEIPQGSITFKKHDLTFTAVDEYGLRSDPYTHSFYYYNFNSPELNVDDFEKTNYSSDETIKANCVVTDLDPEDDLYVYMRFDFEEFKQIHYCNALNRSLCSRFNYSFKIPFKEGTHDIVFQAKDGKNATSKDVVKTIDVYTIPPITPARSPVPKPYPSRLPPDFKGPTTFIIQKTWVPTIVTDNNGNPYTSWTESDTTYNVELVSSSGDPSIVIDDNNGFPKKLIWPIVVGCIAFVILLAVIIVIIIYKRRKDESSSAEVDIQVEPATETVQLGTTDNGEITNENPLFTKTGGEDDPFHDDFEEENDIPQASNSTEDEDVDVDDNDVVL